jgi:hypothetical protein
MKIRLGVQTIGAYQPRELIQRVRRAIEAEMPDAVYAVQYECDVECGERPGGGVADTITVVVESGLKKPAKKPDFSTLGLHQGLHDDDIPY